MRYSTLRAELFQKENNKSAKKCHDFVKTKMSNSDFEDFIKNSNQYIEQTNQFVYESQVDLMELRENVEEIERHHQIESCRIERQVYPESTLAMITRKIFEFIKDIFLSLQASVYRNFHYISSWLW